MSAIVRLLAIGAALAATPLMGAAEDAACGAAQQAGAVPGGGPFTLVSETGATVTDRDVVTGPTLIYFGYAFCPDICPIDIVRNAEAVDILESRGISVQPVFVSVDPGRDTPEVLADYTGSIHPRLLGLTGSPEQVAAVSEAYGVHAEVFDTGDPYYLVEHSTYSYLVLPERGPVARFGRGETAPGLADRIACVLGAG